MQTPPGASLAKSLHPGYQKTLIVKAPLLIYETQLVTDYQSENDYLNTLLVSHSLIHYTQPHALFLCAITLHVELAKIQLTLR